MIIDSCLSESNFCTCSILAKVLTNFDPPNNNLTDTTEHSNLYWCNTVDYNPELNSL